MFEQNPAPHFSAKAIDDTISSQNWRTNEDHALDKHRWQMGKHMHTHIEIVSQTPAHSQNYAPSTTKFL